MTEPILNAQQALDTLRELMLGSESDTARLNAAKILLDRLAPNEDEEERRREQEERDAALAEARGLLAEIAAARLASLCEPDALAEPCAPATDHANDQPVGA